MFEQAVAAALVDLVDLVDLIGDEDESENEPEQVGPGLVEAVRARRRMFL